MAAITAVLGVASSLYQGSQQAEAEKQQASAASAQGQFQEHIYGMNAGAAETSAKSAIAAGDINAERLQTGARMTMGADKSSMAAEGVQVGTGSAADVSRSAGDMSAIDSNQLRTNAWMQAFGLKTQATSDSMQGEFAGEKGQQTSQAYNSAAQASLITGGLNAARSLTQYQYNNQLTYSGRMMYAP